MDFKMVKTLTNARIVTRDAVISGTVVFERGVIRAVDADASRSRSAVDCERDYLLPGLIDIHTDNIEKHIFPRPGVRWPSAFGAVVAHDRELVGAGTTTILDSLSLGDYESAGVRRQALPDVIDAIAKARNAGALRADHFLHFRCEVSDHAVLDLFEPRADHPLLRLVSLMDHTPGDRQFRDPSRFRRHREKTNGRRWSDEEFAAYVTERRAFQAAHAGRLRRAIREIATGRSLRLATHDDTTAVHVEEGHGEGATISEFPTTIEAARRARELGLKTVMGAPNVVLGQSHSGNVSARELATHGLLEALTSDYIPSSLLEATFALSRELGIELPATVAMASAAVADMVGLTDRGSIAAELRADLIRVRLISGHPVVQCAWRGGERVV
jgi:alpha-D-ribose 1-methylphosphonate 5-triphosphate diphosphatase